ncbi:hypothetical protein MUO14_18140 [Halobacillus shinanisalinarum]|uniref:Lipoyl-binding domain-containing protein n=1 Tax=Halobacillus shinanisalinarum TaxID=2932258 RepID=A0ABY4GWP2_9BACI|nr:hypothetical protein [Halobacillus shinanisalinarum]UOQ92369.1 hypothetical protein MUO14_18140 [Halobacillus shinanisalinarum]
MKQNMETVYSPCNGKVEKILIRKNDYVYEWEKLFVVKDKDGLLEEIKIGTSGLIASLEVLENQEVNTHTVLATVKDDFNITGSD